MRHYAVMGGHYAVMAVRCGGALRSNGRCGAAVDYAVMAVDYAVMGGGVTAFILFIFKNISTSLSS